MKSTSHQNSVGIVGQDLAMEQAAALLDESIMDVHLASQAAANLHALNLEEAPRVSCMCADADRRAEDVSALIRWGGMVLSCGDRKFDTKILGIGNPITDIFHSSYLLLVPRYIRQLIVLLNTTAEGPQAAPGSTSGATSSQIGQLLEMTVGASSLLLSESCPICLGNFQENEKLHAVQV